MLADFPATELIDLADQAVQELTVVADDDGSTVEGTDGLLQHVLRRHVEVVCGLVEDEQVDGFQQEAYHGQTAALATTEHLDFLVGLFAAKHEGAEDVVDFQAYLATGHAVDGLEYGELTIQQLGLVLGEVAYLHVMSHLQVTVEGYLAHDTLHERRFSLAVLSDEGYLLASPDGEVDTTEDLVGTVGLANVLADDGEVAATLTGRELQAQCRRIDLVDFDGYYLL